MLRAQAGDRRALEEILVHAERLLQRWLVAALGDLAPDVLQEVLLRVYRKLATLRDPRAFDAWVRRLAHRELLRTLRHERRHAHDELGDVVEEPPPPDDLRARLPLLLIELPPSSRSVLALHYLDDLSLAEIAIVVELPLGTVKSRLALGLRALRKRAQ
ncbi:MAG TPA: RNA polymerase sigma factor [Nannocystaceae bacterium]|nr:RNA polymerase sigma factor [Nannocystaceae bacterium]